LLQVISDVSLANKNELTSIDSIDCSKCYKYCQVVIGLVDPVHTQSHTIHYVHDILAKIDKVREDIPSIIVSSETLKSTPDTRES